MPKITIRIPTDVYAYYELEFGSTEEYERDYKKFVETMIKVRKDIKKQ